MIADRLSRRFFRGSAQHAPRRDVAPPTPWRRTIEPRDPVVPLSALTFNSHRIPYDASGRGDGRLSRPGVHGPLTSTLLADFGRDHQPGRTMRTYTTQARAPLFDTAPFELRGRPTASGCELWAVTPEGTVAMAATAEMA